MERRPVPDKLKRLADGFDRFSVRYDRWFGKILHPAWEALATAFPVEKGARVLDLCAGTGGLLERFARQGADVMGVDVSQGMLEKAAQKLKALGVDPDGRLIRANVAEVDVPDGSFDFVTCSLAVHEMPTPVRQEVFRRMARASRRYVLVFDYFMPRSAVGKAFQALQAPWEWFETPNFLRHYLKADLSAELAALGLDVAPPRRVRGIFPGQGAIWVAQKR